MALSSMTPTIAPLPQTTHSYIYREYLDDDGADDDDDDDDDDDTDEDDRKFDVEGDARLSTTFATSSSFRSIGLPPSTSPPLLMTRPSA